MSAQMTIDQAGLPAGVAGLARTDGLDTGALVTLTATGGGSTTFRLLWVPPADVTAVASLAAVAPGVWTFSPTAGVYGTYRVELISDLGLPTEDRQTRTLAVRTTTLGLVIPAANEGADPTASLVNQGAALIAKSESNEPFSSFLSGSPWGWWRAMAELTEAVEALGGGGGGGAGDTLIFSWNKTDLTQFVGAGPQVLITGGGGPTPPSMSVVSTPRGPAIRIAGGDYDTSTAIFAIAPGALPFGWTDVNRNVRIELEVANVTLVGGGYAGVAFGDSKLGRYFTHMIFGTAEWGGRTTDGVVDSSGATGFGIGYGGLAVTEWRGEAGTVATKPIMSSYLCSLYGPWRQSGDGAALGGGAQARSFGDGTAESIKWKDAQMDSVGLVIRGSGGNLFPSVVDVIGLRVYKL